MKETDEYTKVIFRYWMNGVIAIFPEIPGDLSPQNCLSYQHIGQHSACDPSYIIKSSKPATETQYNNLKVELESLGYKLKVVDKRSPKSIELRRKELANT